LCFYATSGEQACRWITRERRNNAEGKLSKLLTLWWNILKFHTHSYILIFSSKGMFMGEWRSVVKISVCSMQSYIIPPFLQLEIYMLFHKKNWITKKWTAWWEAMKHSKECQHCRHSSTAAFDKMIYAFVSNQVLLLKFKFEIKINEFVFPLLVGRNSFLDWLSVREFLSAFLFLYFLAW